MKTVFKAFLIIFCLLAVSYAALYADEIHLKDSGVINCKIIQVTDADVEYRELNGKPYLSVSKDLVLKIVYDNGAVVQIAENDIPDNTATDEFVENQVQAKKTWNMTDSMFGINLFGGAGIPWGKLLDTEHDLSSVTATYTNGHTETGRPEHYIFYYGLNGDIYLYTGETIKAGLRAKFLKGIIEQEISLGGGEYESKQYYATLLDFNALMAGGQLLWSPFSHRNVSFTSSITAGKLLFSKIKPAPIIQENFSSEYTLPKSKYDVNGYVINASVGAQYAFSTIVLGLDVAYTQFYIEIEDNPYRGLVSDKTNIYAVSFEMFAGVHF